MGIEPPLHPKLGAGGFKTWAGTDWGFLVDHEARARRVQTEAQVPTPLQKAVSATETVHTFIAPAGGVFPLLSPSSLLPFLGTQFP